MKFTIQMTVFPPDHLNVPIEVQTLNVREGGCMENDMLDALFALRDSHTWDAAKYVRFEIWPCP